jgi:cytochrome c553
VKKWLRRIAMGAGALVALVLLLAAGIVGFSSRTLARAYDVPESGIHVTADEAAIARGRHIATAISGCAECHGPDLSGSVIVDDPAMGRIVASNLTTGRGGVLGRYTDAQLERAIRHGINAQGRALLIMPSQDFQHMSDDDVAAVIAYLRTVPPVDNEYPGRRLGPIGRMLVLTVPAFLPASMIDHASVSHDAVQPAVSREYGGYLANIGGCTGCHTATLAGGPMPGGPPGAPPAANLTPAAIGDWTEADFLHAMRDGTRKDGTKINPAMPWLMFRNMTDDELMAIWAYVRAVPAVEPVAS